jgi:hypothetical protein
VLVDCFLALVINVNRLVASCVGLFTRLELLLLIRAGLLSVADHRIRCLVAHLLQLAVFHEDVHLSDEVPDPLQVIIRKLLHVVVAGTVDVVGWVLMATCLEELNSVIKRNNLISAAVDHEDRAVNVWDPVDVRKLVEWQGPTKVENDSEGRHQSGVKD